MSEKQRRRGRWLRWAATGLLIATFVGYDLAGLDLPAWVWGAGVVAVGILLAPWGSMAPMSGPKRAPKA